MIHISKAVEKVRFHCFTCSHLQYPCLCFFFLRKNKPQYFFVWIVHDGADDDAPYSSGSMGRRIEECCPRPPRKENKFSFAQLFVLFFYFYFHPPPPFLLLVPSCSTSTPSSAFSSVVPPQKYITVQSATHLSPNLRTTTKKKMMTTEQAKKMYAKKKKILLLCLCPSTLQPHMAFPTHFFLTCMCLLHPFQVFMIFFIYRTLAFLTSLFRLALPIQSSLSFFHSISHCSSLFVYFVFFSFWFVLYLHTRSIDATIARNGYASHNQEEEKKITSDEKNRFLGSAY